MNEVRPTVTITPEQRQAAQRATMLRNVKENAGCQSSVECRENYFRSCEAHGGEMVLVIAEVKKEFVT